MSEHFVPPVLSPEAARRVISSYQHVFTRLVPLTSRFYESLVRDHPDMAAYLPEDIGAQMNAVARSLGNTVAILHNPARAQAEMRALGRVYKQQGVDDGAYAVFAEALIEALADSLGADWDDPLEQAWRRLVMCVSDALAQGAREKEAPRSSATIARTPDYRHGLGKGHQRAPPKS